MCRKFYFIILVITSLFVLSCNFSKPINGNGKLTKTERELKDDFTSVEIEGDYTLVLNQGSTAKLSVEADDNIAEYIEDKVKSHKLIIKNKKKIHSDKGITIYLTINNIKQIDLSGAVVLHSADKINFDSFTINLNGASNVGMDLNCYSFKATCNGSSTLKLLGAANDADIEVTGACDIDNQQMPVENMKLNVDGGAKVIVNVLAKLDVKVKGSAQVEYYGSPDVHKEITGSGTVEKIF